VPTGQRAAIDKLVRRRCDPATDPAQGQVYCLN
jgi:hypothetical protein